MKPATLAPTHKAFTLIELLVVIVILGVLIALVYPVNHGRRSKASSIVCMNNLKQVGLGFLMYANDHADQFPWQIPTNPVATSEAMELSTSEHFLVLSNYSLSSSILVCPTDISRTKATNYSRFSNTNLSYFAALNATAISGSNVWQLILAGDRHLSVDGQAVKSGVCVLTDKSVPGWTKELHSSDTKGTRGCLLFADGHVQFVPAKDSPRIFNDQHVTTSRLSIP